MAALDFPNSPTVGQQYVATNGSIYSWDGTVWASLAQGQAVYIGVNPPPNPPVGNLWWRSDPDQNLYLYYDDGNSKQYVNAVPSVSQPTGPAGGSLSGTYPNPTLAPGASIGAYSKQTGPASQFTYAGGTAAFIFSSTITALANRPCLLLGNIMSQTQKVTAVAAVTINVYVEFWVGGTATGRDGTFLGPTQTFSFRITSNGDSLTYPALMLAQFTPVAAGALYFKVFGACADVTNYTSLIAANQSFLTIQQLA